MTRNLTEEIRIAIGKLLLVHEFKKLFRVDDPHFLETIKAGIEHLGNEASTGNDIGVRNFWNLVDAIMRGFMLKDLVPKITSAGIDWSLRDLPVGNLKFTSDITKIEGFDINKKSFNEVKQYFESNPDKLAIVKQTTLEKYPEGDARYIDPIIVLNEDDGDFVHDGNGRLMRVIINKGKTLSAYVGSRNNKTISNHWVPTSYLFFLKEAAGKDQSFTDLLNKVIASSQNAKYEWENRVI